MALFKSGRSAVAAVFRAMARRHPGAAVLVPDYICNVIHRAAVPYDVRLVTYRTDARFQVDLDDLEAKIRAESAKGVLLASLFGSQGRSRSVIDRIRVIDRELVLIVDDCLNLVTGMPFDPDDRTVVVFSFNMKHVPGVMGGGVCSKADPLEIEPPARDFRSDFLQEMHVLLALLLQVRDALTRAVLGLAGRPRWFGPPEIGFSDCARRLYDTQVQRIARLSLIRGIVGLAGLGRREARRRENFARFRDAIEGNQWGRVVATENAAASPMVAVEGLHPGLRSRLHLKGSYALDHDPGTSLRPGIVLFFNDGLYPIDLVRTRQGRR
jgi:hypothetical protein